MAWQVMQYTPYVKRISEAASLKRPLWPGGTLIREPLELETTYRLMNGTRKTYTGTAGWHPWRWTWEFDRMPFPWMNQLWLYRDWNKGTQSVAPGAIHLWPNIKEIALVNASDPLNSTWVPVDIVSIMARRVLAPRGQLIGYTGSVVFESAYNNESIDAATGMVGGDVLTDELIGG